MRIRKDERDDSGRFSSTGGGTADTPTPREQFAIDRAERQLYAPVADWVHRPDAAGKEAVFAAYEKLSPADRAAYDAHVVRTFRREHDGDTAVVYRYGERGKMGGASVSTVRPSYLARDKYDAYIVHAKDVLVHYGQEDMPLSGRAFGHEKEIILRSDAAPRKIGG